MALAEILRWIDARFPIKTMWNNQLCQYYVPKNFNFWYLFGSLALLILVNQILTGIWLAMFYVPSAAEAFDSVEYIMRDVNFGWLLRYMHTTGASLFFVIIYLHMFRALLYGSFKKPRELVWLLGVLLYFFLMMEAFMGYLLPWGQMSYWGAQVITNLLSAIPFVGDGLVTWIRGDYTVSTVTLNRFYALHIIAIPLMFIFLVWMHLTALHRVGSNNPEGNPVKGVPFHPYYTVKDFFGATVFLIIFFGIVFFAPEFGGYFLEPDNFLQANPLQTPEDISPVWYLTPFYAMLRAIPNKLFGVITLAASILILFFLPWLDASPTKSIRYRPLFFKIILGLFAITFLALMYLGSVPVTPNKSLLARFFTILYFAFFIGMPWYTRYEKSQNINVEHQL